MPVYETGGRWFKSSRDYQIRSVDIVCINIHMNQCLKCGNNIPWRTFNGQRTISLTKRKYCLECSPLYGRNTKKLISVISGKKRCPRCKTEKRHDEFYVRSDGRPSVYCKPCTSDESAERKVKFKQRAIEYKGGSCQRCGFLGQAVCYDFHHRNRKDKEMEISRMKKSWETAKKELDKCDLLCANCHRIVEAELLQPECLLTGVKSPM